MNYTQTTFFGPKDSLPIGNSAKTILGTQVDIELANIADAIATKLDASILQSSVGFIAGVNTAPAIYFGSDTTTGFYSPGNAMLALVSNGNTILSIDGAGNGSLTVNGTFNLNATTVALAAVEISNQLTVNGAVQLTTGYTGGSATTNTEANDPLMLSGVPATTSYPVQEATPILFESTYIDTLHGSTAVNTNQWAIECFAQSVAGFTYSINSNSFGGVQLQGSTTFGYFNPAFLTEPQTYLNILSSFAPGGAGGGGLDLGPAFASIPFSNGLVLMPNLEVGDVLAAPSFYSSQVVITGQLTKGGAAIVPFTVNTESVSGTLQYGSQFLSDNTAVYVGAGTSATYNYPCLMVSGGLDAPGTGSGLFAGGSIGFAQGAPGVGSGLTMANATWGLSHMGNNGFALFYTNASGTPAQQNLPQANSSNVLIAAEWSANGALQLNAPSSGPTLTVIPKAGDPAILINGDGNNAVLAFASTGSASYNAVLNSGAGGNLQMEQNGIIFFSAPNGSETKASILDDSNTLQTIGFRQEILDTVSAANYTLVIGDRAHCKYLTAGAPAVVNIQPNVFNGGDVVILMTNGSTTATVEPAAGMSLYLIDGATGQASANRSLVAYAYARVLFTSATSAVVMGYGVS